MAWIQGKKTDAFRVPVPPPTQDDKFPPPYRLGGDLIDDEVSIIAYLPDLGNPSNLKRMQPIHLEGVAEVTPQQGKSAALWDKALIVEAGSELGFHITAKTRYGFGLSMQRPAEVIWDGYYQTNTMQVSAAKKLTMSVDRYYRAAEHPSSLKAIKVQGWQDFENSRQDWTQFQRVSVSVWPLVRFRQGGSEYGAPNPAIRLMAAAVSVRGGGITRGRDVGELKGDDLPFMVLEEARDLSVSIGFSIFVAKEPDTVMRDVLLR